MAKKRTNTNTLILAALGGLVVYCLYNKKQNAASLGSLNRYGMEGKKNMQEVFDVIETGRPGTFNDELTYDSESITASISVMPESLREQVSRMRIKKEPVRN